MRECDGSLIEILGREDSQVKLNGFRIELGEIEHPRIGRSYRACMRRRSDGRQLVSFVTLAPPGDRILLRGSTLQDVYDNVCAAGQPANGPCEDGCIMSSRSGQQHGQPLPLRRVWLVGDSTIGRIRMHTGCRVFGSVLEPGAAAPAAPHCVCGASSSEKAIAQPRGCC